MDMKAVVEAGGHGLDAVIDNVAKLRSALPGEARALADSAVGTEVASMLSAASERAEVARIAALEAASSAKDGAAGATDAALAKVAEAAESLKARAEEVAEAVEADSSRRSRIPRVLAAVAVTGAAAAAGVLVWRRRQAAAASGAEQEPESGASFGGEVAHTPSVADDESPEVMDPHFAEEVDEAAEELAEEFVEAVEIGEQHVAEPQQPEVPHTPSVADDESPEVMDPHFAEEVDAAADALAEEFVEAVENDEGKAP